MPCVSASTTSRAVGVELRELGAGSARARRARTSSPSSRSDVTSGATSRAARSARYRSISAARISRTLPISPRRRSAERCA